MFSVANCLKRHQDTNDNQKDILVIQNGYDDYVMSMSNIPNLDIYLYHDRWSTPIESTPSNIHIIKNLDRPIKSSFDNIICFGAADDAQIAKTLRDRMRTPLILIQNASPETYAPRAYTFKIKNEIEVGECNKVSLDRSFSSEDSVVIPHVLRSPCIEKKQNQICTYHMIPDQTMSSFKSCLKDEELLPFSEENIRSSKVFLDTVIGFTPHIISAMLNGCMIVAPYSKEMEDIGKGLFYLYNDFQEMKSLVEKAKASESGSQAKILGIAASRLIEQKQFNQKWLSVLQG